MLSKFWIPSRWINLCSCRYFSCSVTLTKFLKKWLFEDFVFVIAFFKLDWARGKLFCIIVCKKVKVHIVHYIIVTDRKGLSQCRWFYVNEPKWPTTPMGHWTLPGKQFSNLEYLRYVFKLSLFFQWKGTTGCGSSLTSSLHNNGQKIGPL